MASSSSGDSQIKHDVFISFSGKDTRRGFLSHLVKELRRAKIIPYVDENLNRGEEISSSLVRAIQESQISIVIFSENYASSRWCLDELAEIIECMKGNRQVVLPVFYYMDPSDVRHQKGTYEKAFVNHKLKYQNNKNKVQNWRQYLEDAAALSGYDSSHFGNDSVLINEIVREVSLKLDHIYLSESRGLVGIDKYVLEIREIMVKETKEVKIIGICGIGGIGKTTLAQLAYDKFSSLYEGSYFLNNVRQESQKHGLESLREKLISELQEGRSTIVLKNLLSRRKVLVVLDDVSTLKQLEHLVTKRIQWGPGSRIIVTSRDKHMLISGGVHFLYELQPLDIEKSVNLFSLHAFKKGHPERGYEVLLHRALDYTHGLPLALKVLGLGFYSGDRETWKAKLETLRRRPDIPMLHILKMSYDELRDVEKDIFLDIAFFYIGEDKDGVIRLLDANNLFSSWKVKGLLDKGLISISHDNKIQMHDLIQQMGWEIVRQEGKRRSRLKEPEEVLDVLRNDQENADIEGIVINASVLKDIQLNVESFRNMPNLIIVKFYSPWHEASFYVRQGKGLGLFSSESIRYP